MAALGFAVMKYESNTKAPAPNGPQICHMANAVRRETPGGIGVAKISSRSKEQRCRNCESLSSRQSPHCLPELRVGAYHFHLL